MAQGTDSQTACIAVKVKGGFSPPVTIHRSALAAKLEAGFIEVDVADDGTVSELAAQDKGRSKADTDKE